MVTAAAATAFRIQGRNGTGVSLSERLRVINEEVLRVGGGHYQMTMSAIELDGRTGRFVYHSAGGQPIMRLRADGRPKLLPCPGTPLGTDSFNLGRVEGTMMPGERMIIYTDGIPELQLANGRLLGMRRFSMICERTRGLNLEQATQQIVLASDMLRQNMPQEDDWTFAMVEWSGQA
jgi:serine phosphatase RsbU (regulator of sigma subunit)